MSGELRTCKRCGNSYIWSYEDQRDYRVKDYVPPLHCKECRDIRRQERREREGRQVSRSRTPVQPPRQQPLPSSTSNIPIAVPYILIGAGIVFLLLTLFLFLQ